MSDTQKPLSICLVAGEESGDLLGAELMAALRKKTGRPIRFSGVGGDRMIARGLTSFFDISDVAVMGLSAVLARLPLIVRRVYQTVDGVIAARPDIVVIIDSPDFTHNVAKRVRKRAPDIPIVGYVSPSVWAWRSGRARRMRAYVDALLALLPFEPEIHQKLGGPATHYVGHPLSENVGNLTPEAGERTPLSAPRKVILVLPGSRGSEVDRLLATFGATIARVKAIHPEVEVLLPAVPHLEARIRDGVASWPVKPEIVTGTADKQAAFRRAHAALAASGTVSLELALARVPMVIAYKLDWFYRRVKELNQLLRFSSVNSMVLPNIILGRNVIPEYLDDDASPDMLSTRLLELLSDSAERRRQADAFETLEERMTLPEGYSQSAAAADVVLHCLEAGRV